MSAKVLDVVVPATAVNPSLNGAPSSGLGWMEIVTITPAVAEAMLAKNVGNRRLVQSVVERYAGDMIAGRWRDSDQSPFMLRDDGGLLNGQHRLRAIMLSGRTMQAFVHHVEGDVGPMDLRVDTGRGRTATDILEISAALSGTARFLYTVATNSPNAGVTVDRIKDTVERITPEYNRMTTSSRRGFSTAGVRAALCLGMWRYPTEAYDIAGQYYAIVHDEFNADVWPALRSATRYILKSAFRTGKADQMDAFLRVSRALEPEARYNEKVSFKDQGLYRAKVVPQVCSYLGLPGTAVPPVRP